MKKKVLAVAMTGMLLPVMAHAVDYTAAATAATTEVNSAVAAAIPVGILVLAATIGWRLFKRFARG